MEALMERIESSKRESEEIYSAKYLKNSFLHFFFLAFSVALRRVDGAYIIPGHLREWCGRIQFFKRTSTIAPRYHLKSTLMEAYVMWKMYRCEHNWNEWMYMSYTGDSAAYHTKRIKRYIQAMPELFEGYQNLTESESILYYRDPEGRIFYCEPVGILTFQRGKHPNGMILDDILRDPQVKLDISQLEKIARTFFEEIAQMPKEELHLVGTPQDQEDLFAQLESKSGYSCKRYDAIVDEQKGIALWEDNPNFCYKALVDIRDNRIGAKAFMKEFRCMPVRGTEGFISLDEYARIECGRIKNYDILWPPKLKEYTVVAGFDIGKKTHPSHLCVLVERKGIAWQVHSKFLDGWNYHDQIEYLSQAVEAFKIDKMLYDNTRSEFEESFERGELPACMDGVSFTAKSKFAMAAELDKAVTNKKLKLVADGRQKRQILSVDCDLKAPETSEGHGDAFFSLCLAVQALKEVNGVGIMFA